MIIPSIDLLRANAVQLVGGKHLEINAGDPLPIMERFRVAGEVAVIDRDAALGSGSNAGAIVELIKAGPCRVGGGIRDEKSALKWLDRGASKIIFGTAATPELLSRLPRERVIATLDARGGEVVIEGSARSSRSSIFERMQLLRDYVGGFLVKTIEREGRMEGADIALASELVKAAGDARVTLAGGVKTGEEIAELDGIGCDAQIGMALYANELDLGDAVFAPGTSDRIDGLIPTVIADERGTALAFVYSDAESVRRAVAQRRGVYYSRKSGPWAKGEASGDTQELLRIDWDCDRDSLRFTVRESSDGNYDLGTRLRCCDDTGLGALGRRMAN